MKVYDIMMFGHLSKDVLIDYLGNEERLFGGPVVQSSAAAVRSQASVLVVTKASKHDDDGLSTIQSNGAEWLIYDSPETTSVKNVYHTENQERRDVTILSRADSFTLEEIPSTPARIYHLAGIFRGEIPDTYIEKLSKLAKLAVDAGGILRYYDGKQLFARDWKDKLKYLPMITYLKVDAAEAELMTGEHDRVAAAKILCSWGAEEVMLTYHKEVIICRGEEIFRAPYTNKSFVGRTGRGDSTFAAYLSRRLEHSIQDSLVYAVALCSLKMETPGPFSLEMKDVFDRIEQDYK